MTDQSKTEREYVRIEEAAALFGVSRATIYEWIKKWNIPRYTTGQDKLVKFVKPEEIRAARAEAAKSMIQFKRIDEDKQGEE